MFSYALDSSPLLVRKEAGLVMLGSNASELEYRELHLVASKVAARLPESRRQRRS